MKLGEFRYKHSNSKRNRICSLSATALVMASLPTNDDPMLCKGPVGDDLILRVIWTFESLLGTSTLLNPLNNMDELKQVGKRKIKKVA